MDTNYVARMAWSAADRNGPSDLQTALAASRITAYAGAHVPAELERRIGRLHPHRDPEPAMAAWRMHIAPVIRVVDLPLRWYLDPALTAVLRDDEDDLPTAALASFLAPVVILSTDGVFARAGQELPSDPRVAVTAITSACRYEDMAFLGAAVTAVTLQSAGRGVMSALRAARADPPSALALLGLVGFLALVVHDTRPSGAAPLRQRAAQLLRSAGARALEIAGSIAEDHQAATSTITVAPRYLPHTLEEAAAAVLARHGRPISVADLRQDLRRPAPGYGSPTPHQPSAAQLTLMLRGCSAFTHSPRGWSLGRPAQPGGS